MINLFAVKPPTIRTQPLTQTAIFICSANGCNLSYEWTIGSGSFPRKVTDINSDTLMIPDVRLSDKNTYTCTVNNDGGRVTYIK